MIRYIARKRMRELGLVSCQQSMHRYKKSGGENICVPNQLDRQFNVNKPNQAWRGDMTYVWTGNRWAYLAVALDLYARQVVGWAVSTFPDSELTTKALRNAFESRGRPKGLMFHSDQGCHYTGIRLKQVL